MYNFLVVTMPHGLQLSAERIYHIQAKHATCRASHSSE